MPLPRIPALSKNKPTISFIQENGTNAYTYQSVQQYNNECVAFALVEINQPHVKNLSQFITDTCIWYYRQAKNKPYIWKYNVLFGQRLIKSVNSSLLKEMTRQHINSTLKATFAFFRISEHKLILYDLGETYLYVLKKNEVIQIQGNDQDGIGDTSKHTLGTNELLNPRIATKEVITNEIFLLVSRGIGDWVTKDDIQELICNHPDNFLEHLVKRATSYGSVENKIIVMIQV
jgi:serine/threonine protein phosphatase PrpC